MLLRGLNSRSEINPFAHFKALRVYCQHIFREETSVQTTTTSLFSQCCSGQPGIAPALLGLSGSLPPGLGKGTPEEREINEDEACGSDLSGPWGQVGRGLHVR